MARLRVNVLGSAAGGGYPQWNCRCRTCSLFWQGDQRVQARTQSSIGVTADDRYWVLLNCSPDVRSQILRSPVLHPTRSKRDSPVAAVFLTNGDIDHVAGLLSLREGQPFSIYGTRAVLGAIADNAMFAAVDERITPRRVVELGRSLELPGGIEIEPFAVPGKVPLYQEGATVDVGVESETTVGVKISGVGSHFYYVPGCAEVTPRIQEILDGAPLVFFDGTLWRDDEMIVEGIGEKTGHRMGHVSMSGPEGSIARLADVRIGRRIFLHINNTNPVLIDGSPERLEAEARGWEIAYDGMEIVL